MNENNSIPQLYYSENSEWYTLPQWAKFFIEAGNCIADFGSSSQLTVCMIVPTNAYEAILTAFGLIIELSKGIEIKEPEEKFREISNLPKGTPVSYVIDNRIKKGVYQGTKVIHGQTLVGIQIENERTGGGTNWLSSKQCGSVKVLESNSLLLPKKQKGQIMFKKEELLRTLLSMDHLEEFCNNSDLHCAIIGNISKLRSEITNTVLSTNPKNLNCIGSLKNILRVKQFLRDGDSYNMEILKSIGSNIPQLQNEFMPHLVIFDGGSGYIKWRDYFKFSHFLIILNRTDPNIKDAILTFNTEYIQNRESEFELQEKINIPNGIEVSAFINKL